VGLALSLPPPFRLSSSLSLCSSPLYLQSSLCLVQFSSDDTTPILGPSGTRPETLLVRTSPRFREIFNFRPSETLPVSPSCSRFVPSRVSYFPVPRSHISNQSFVFPHRAGLGQLHLPNLDTRVTHLLHWRTDLRSIAFPSPCHWGQTPLYQASICLVHGGSMSRILTLSWIRTC
jgi:hypothetical protein